MGERVSIVSIQARLDAGDAVDGVRSLKDGLTGVAAAGEAAAGGVKQVAPAANEAAGATDKLDAAVQRLDATSGRGLLRAITQAKLEVNALEAQLATLPAGSAGFKQIESAIAAANVKVEQGIARFIAYKQELREINERVALTDKATEAFGGSMGRLAGAMSPVIKTFGDLAMGGAALTLAIEGPRLALELAQKAMDGVKEASIRLGDAIVDHVAKQKDAEVEAVRLQAANRAVQQGLIEQGTTVRETIAHWEAFVATHNHVRESWEAFAKGIAGAKVSETFAQTQDAAVKMETALALAFQQGKADFLQFAMANESHLKEIAEAYKIHGEKVPEYIQKAIDATKQWNEVQKQEADQAERVKHAGELKLQQLIKEYEVQQKLRNEVAKAMGEEERSIIEIARAYKNGEINADQAAQAVARYAEKNGIAAEKVTAYAKAITDATAEGRKNTEVSNTMADAIDKLLKAASPSAEVFAHMTEEIVRQTEAAANYVRTLNEAKQAAEDMGRAQQQSADMMKSADLGGQMEQLAGGVSTAAQGVRATMTLMAATTREAADTTIAEVERMSNAWAKLDQSNSGMAERGANAIALLTDAWRSGIQSIGEWTRTWQAYYDQLEQMIAKNPGTQIAKDMQKVVDMLDELKKRVISGELKPAEHVNL